MKQSKKLIYKPDAYDEEENEIDLEGVCAQNKRKNAGAKELYPVDEEELDPLCYIQIDDSDSETREQLLNSYKE